MIRWSVESGFITIPKSSKPERIDENSSIFDFSLDADDMAAIVSYMIIQCIVPEQPSVILRYFTCVW